MSTRQNSQDLQSSPPELQTPPLIDGPQRRFFSSRPEDLKTISLCPDRTAPALPIHLARRHEILVPAFDYPLSTSLPALWSRLPFLPYCITSLRPSIQRRS